MASIETFPVLVGLAFTLSACGTSDDRSSDAVVARPSCESVAAAVVAIPDGTFVMGSDAVYSEEGPPRTTRVDQFWIDRSEVTNSQFERFVAATGYRTVAELPVDPSSFGMPEDEIPPDLLKAGSAVFFAPAGTEQSGGWRYLPGAYWRMPQGPRGPEARADHPVVHLAYEDMAAYAEWRGGRLPSEAEWEYAATAGAPETIEQPAPTGANSWQGVFPYLDEGRDGYRDTAPVGCFKPNAFGLFDMIGNVWEVTADYYQDGHDPLRNDNPSGPSLIELRRTSVSNDGPDQFDRVMKGGSYLCAPNYCRRYRPEARHARDPGLGASNVGFRVAYDESIPPQ